MKNSRLFGTVRSTSVKSSANRSSSGGRGALALGFQSVRLALSMLRTRLLMLVRSLRVKIILLFSFVAALQLLFSSSPSTTTNSLLDELQQQHAFRRLEIVRDGAYDSGGGGGGGGGERLDELIDVYCNVRNLNVNITCLDMLRRYDEDGAKQKNKRNSNACASCLHYRERQRESAAVGNGSSLHRPIVKRLMINYHTFWQVKLDEAKPGRNEHFYRMIALNIMSYLSTQNLCCTRFTLWKLADFPATFEYRLATTFAAYIANGTLQLRTFDMRRFCDDERSSFRGSDICTPARLTIIESGSLVSLSDLVRFVVLDVYGGIYTDGDVIYLKCMRELWQYTFAYRWSYTERLNTAVLGINRQLNPDTVRRFYRRLITQATMRSYAYTLQLFVASYLFDFNYMTYRFHPYTISEMILNEKTPPKDSAQSNGHKSWLNYHYLTTFSSTLFDPAWLCHDGFARLRADLVCNFDEFTSRVLLANASQFDPRQFFGGAFTYHIHLSNGKKSIVAGSYFDLFERHYTSVLKLNEV